MRLEVQGRKVTTFSHLMSKGACLHPWETLGMGCNIPSERLVCGSEEVVLISAEEHSRMGWGLCCALLAQAPIRWGGVSCLQISASSSVTRMKPHHDYPFGGGGGGGDLDIMGASSLWFRPTSSLLKGDMTQAPLVPLTVSENRCVYQAQHQHLNGPDYKVLCLSYWNKHVHTLTHAHT